MLLGIVHSKTFQEGLRRDCLRESNSQSSAAQLFFSKIDLPENVTLAVLSHQFPLDALPPLCMSLATLGAKHRQVLKEEFKGWC